MKLIREENKRASCNLIIMQDLRRSHVLFCNINECSNTEFDITEFLLILEFQNVN